MAETREKAKALIMAGAVLAGTRRIDKPGLPLDATVAATLSLKAGATLKYVSRGGLKLERALEVFGIEAAGKLVLDIGASTGGFTDCVLQRGARQVVAVDVGQQQLAWSLQTDRRVFVLDKTNIRYLEALPALAADAPAGQLAEMVVIDVSFISLKLVLPPARRLSQPAAPIVALVKPQFEAGREQVGKGGIIKDPAVHRAVLRDLIEWCHQNDFEVRGLIPSPILGTEGNREFLVNLLAAAPGDTNRPNQIAIEIDALIDRAMLSPAAEQPQHEKE